MNVDLLKVDFSKYESPITKIVGKAIEEMQTKMIQQEEDRLIMECRETVGFHVNKDELIRALNYDRDQYAKGYADGLNADRWIPVSEKLPEDGIYLVTVERTTNKPRVEIKSFSKDLNKVDDYDFPEHKCGWYEYDSEYGYWEDTDVIAWMPLPQPMKVGEENC